MQAILANLTEYALTNAPAVVGFVILSVVAPFVVKWLRTHTTAQQQAMVADAASVAYWAVEHVAPTNDTTAKIAQALKLMQDQLAPKGVNIPGDVATAILQGLHAQAIASVANGPKLPA